MANQSLLKCLCLGGAEKYDLPAESCGNHEGYAVYFRRAPADVIHHIHNKTIVLDQSEAVLVRLGGNHCISVSFDVDNMPVGAYVNINLVPSRHEIGWQWEDLELDVKFSVSFNGAWSPLLLDVDEFESAMQSSDQKQIAESEVINILNLANENFFPFGKRTAGLGLDVILEMLNFDKEN